MFRKKLALLEKLWSLAGIYFRKGLSRKDRSFIFCNNQSICKKFLLQEGITDVMIGIRKWGIGMIMYYDRTAVRINEPLQAKQELIAISTEREPDLEESAAGGLHKYANPALIKQEKDTWIKLL